MLIYLRLIVLFYFVISSLNCFVSDCYGGLLILVVVLLAWFRWWLLHWFVDVPCLFVVSVYFVRFCCVVWFG